MGYKVNIRLCDACPNLEHCIAFPNLPLGHHPNGRCPDGFMEKVFPWEIPGPEYRRPDSRGRHNDKISPDSREIYAVYNRESYTGYKSKWCILCMFKRKRQPVSKGSKYWLCRQCAARVFIPWKKKHKGVLARLKGKGRAYVFKVKNWYLTNRPNCDII